MLTLIQKDDINLYLESSPVVDYDNPEIQKKAQELSQDLDQLAMVENVYHFVRDEINHSMDVGEDAVTFKASEVLEKGHGLCFAKSNLLAALLRFNCVHTGFCYQSLVHEDGFILHGLNAVFLGDQWIRLDSRGNNKGIDAQFCIDKESLAFYTQLEGEKDYPYIYSRPDDSVIQVMVSSKNLEEVYRNLLAAIR